MERMLRRNKNNEYEIDRELTGKFAIEKNAEYQEKIEQLEEENKVIKEEKEMLIRQNTLLQESNKKLKSDLAEIQKIGESWRQECKQLREDVDYFRQCYLDLKKLCEKEGFMLSDEEVTKMFNLDKIK